MNRVILPAPHSPLRALFDVPSLIEAVKEPQSWQDAIRKAREYLRATPEAKSVNALAYIDGELVLGTVNRTRCRVLWYFNHGTETPPPLHDNWD